MIVVSDTSPICYLLLIDQINLLPRLYNQVIIPQAVCEELGAEESPEIVQNWIAKPPKWLEVQSVEIAPDAAIERLDVGEGEAILLAEQLGADLILLDEKTGRRVAMERGLKVIGLLGILDDAATQGLIDLPVLVERLQQTTFWASSNLIEWLLAKHNTEL
ncbi:MAG: DUF3368 domain-containing protein [Symploca sp. SIO2D2]|nr:DUF3368 domain-containing protein [Symploca sp. SIO2D2]